MKIFAVGNSFYGDDGVGAAVLERIRECEAFPGAEPVNVEDLKLHGHPKYTGASATNAPPNDPLDKRAPRFWPGMDSKPG